MKERGRVVEWAIGLERRGKIDAVLALARCLEPLADSGEDFDRDGWLLCTPSGVSKGFMTPDILVIANGRGEKVSGEAKKVAGKVTDTL